MNNNNAIKVTSQEEFHNIIEEIRKVYDSKQLPKRVIYPTPLIIFEITKVGIDSHNYEPIYYLHIVDIKKRKDYYKLIKGYDGLRFEFQTEQEKFKFSQKKKKSP